MGTFQRNASVVTGSVVCTGPCPEVAEQSPGPLTAKKRFLWAVVARKQWAAGLATQRLCCTSTNPHLDTATASAVTLDKGRG